MVKINENFVNLYTRWKSGRKRKESNYIDDFIKRQDFDYAIEVEEDGSICVKYSSIKITDDDLINGKLAFRFSKIKGSISFMDCKTLVSLEGLPEEMTSGYFDADNCEKLETFDFMPKSLRKDIDIYASNCFSLKSLKGLPDEVDGLMIRHCISLESLEGCPKIINKNFDMSGCKNIKSLDGFPKYIGGDLSAHNIGLKIDKNTIKEICEVKGNIFIS